MKHSALKAISLTAIILLSAGTALAQISITKGLSSLKQAAQAFTLTDSQMAEYVKESVAQMDKENTVLGDDSPYTQRLNKLTKGITDADGIALNFKVYQTSDVNAFACPDGSVRVYTGLMDLMDDDELLGVIGHEIGHVVKRHSKNAFKNELLTGALKDAIASTSTTAASLTESQLSTLGQSLLNAKYSQKQESEADDCGYDFLVENGRNPWGMAMAFEKLQTLESSSDSQTSSYIQKMFSSHPDTATRIQNMTERCEKDGYQRPTTETTTTTSKKSTSTSKKSTTSTKNSTTSTTSTKKSTTKTSSSSIEKIATAAKKVITKKSSSKTKK